jgi:hypothetical protein
MSREARRASVLSWAADAREKANAGGEDAPRPPVAGIQEIVHSNFDTRPNHPASRSRPRAFGEPKLKDAHRKGMIEVMQGFQRCLERYPRGERTVTFPDGVYVPPVVQAA